MLGYGRHLGGGLIDEDLAVSPAVTASSEEQVAPRFVLWPESGFGPDQGSRSSERAPGSVSDPVPSLSLILPIRLAVDARILRTGEHGGPITDSPEIAPIFAFGRHQRFLSVRERSTQTGELELLAVRVAKWATTKPDICPRSTILSPDVQSLSLRGYKWSGLRSDNGL
jgi:hypothetical protein